jgi:hypothetical protein
MSVLRAGHLFGALTSSLLAQSLISDGGKTLVCCIFLMSTHW